MEICYNATDVWPGERPFDIESSEGTVTGVIENGLDWEVGRARRAHYVPFIIYTKKQPHCEEEKYKGWGVKTHHVCVHTTCTMPAKCDARLSDLPRAIAHEMLGLLKWALQNSHEKQTSKWSKKIKMSIGQLQSLLSARDAEPLTRRLDFVCGSAWLPRAPSLQTMLGNSFVAWFSEPSLLPPVMFRPGDRNVCPEDGLRLLTRRFQDTVVSDLAAGECICCLKAKCVTSMCFNTFAPPATALKHRVVLIVSHNDVIEILHEGPACLFRALWLKGALRWVTSSSVDNATLELDSATGKLDVCKEGDMVYIFVLSVAQEAFFTWTCLKRRAHEQVHSSLMAAVLGRRLASEQPHVELDVHACLQSLPASWRRPSKEQAAAFARLMAHSSPVKVVQAPPGTGKSELLALHLWCILQTLPSNAKCVVTSPNNFLANGLAAFLEHKFGKVVLRMGADNMERAIAGAAKQLDDVAAKRLEDIEKQLLCSKSVISKQDFFTLLSEHMGHCHALHVAGRSAAKKFVKFSSRVFVGTKEWFLRYIAKQTSGPQLLTDIRCLYVDGAEQWSVAELASTLGANVQNLLAIGRELRREPKRRM
jgi:hypothetical protein